MQALLTIGTLALLSLPLSLMALPFILLALYIAGGKKKEQVTAPVEDEAFDVEKLMGGGE